MNPFESIDFGRQYNDLRKIPEEAIEVYLQELRRADAHVIDSLKIVDVGAGSGLYSDLLLSVSDREVIALEPASGMFQTIKYRNKDIICINDRIPLKNKIPEAGIAWCSDILHLFTSPDIFIKELEESLPNITSIVIRQTSPALLSRTDWAEFFPNVLTKDSMRHFTAEKIIAAFAERGWQILTCKFVNESFNMDKDAYISYYQNKPFSGLHLIEIEDFDKGMSKIREYASMRESLERRVFRWCYTLIR